MAPRSKSKRKGSAKAAVIEDPASKGCRVPLYSESKRFRKSSISQKINLLNSVNSVGSDEEVVSEAKVVKVASGQCEVARAPENDLSEAGNVDSAVMKLAENDLSEAGNVDSAVANLPDVLRPNWTNSRRYSTKTNFNA